MFMHYRVNTNKYYDNDMILYQGNLLLKLESNV